MINLQSVDERIKSFQQQNVRLMAILAVMVLGCNLINGIVINELVRHQHKEIYETMDNFIIQKEPDTLITDLPHQKLGQFELSFYCPCEKCVGKKKKVTTASGTTPKAGRTIAVDTNIIPMGSILYVEGYGYFIAEDRGSAIKGRRLDIFCNTHKEALQNGKRIANVYLLEANQ